MELYWYKRIPLRWIIVCQNVIYSLILIWCLWFMIDDIFLLNWGFFGHKNSLGPHLFLFKSSGIWTYRKFIFILLQTREIASGKIINISKNLIINSLFVLNVKHIHFHSNLNFISKAQGNNNTFNTWQF